MPCSVRSPDSLSADTICLLCDRSGIAIPEDRHSIYSEVVLVQPCCQQPSIKNGNGEYTIERIVEEWR
jgi:hypothetical protein